MADVEVSVALPINPLPVIAMRTGLVKGGSGEDGAAGLVNMGTWSSSGAYTNTPSTDIVTYEDPVTHLTQVWQCVAPVGPSATPPPSDPTHWSLFVGGTNVTFINLDGGDAYSEYGGTMSFDGGGASG